MRFRGGYEERRSWLVLQQYYLFTFSSPGRRIRQPGEDMGQVYLNSFQRHGRVLRCLYWIRAANIALHLIKRWREIPSIWAVGWGYLAIWQFLEAFPLFDYKFITYKRKAGTRRRRYGGYYKYLWGRRRQMVSGSRFDQFQKYSHAETVEERLIFAFWYLTNRNFENEVLGLFKEVGKRSLELSQFWRYSYKKPSNWWRLSYLYKLARRVHVFRFRQIDMGGWIEKQRVGGYRRWRVPQRFFQVVWSRRRYYRGAWKRTYVKVFFYSFLLVFGIISYVAGLFILSYRVFYYYFWGTGFTSSN